MTFMHTRRECNVSISNERSCVAKMIMAENEMGARFADFNYR